jgi:hypothetical protein
MDETCSIFINVRLGTSILLHLWPKTPSMVRLVEVPKGARQHPRGEKTHHHRPRLSSLNRVMVVNSLLSSFHPAFTSLSVTDHGFFERSKSRHLESPVVVYLNTSDSIRVVRICANIFVHKGTFTVTSIMPMLMLQ